jgi:predicted RND superfamily exporter protein
MMVVRRFDWLIVLLSLLLFYGSFLAIKHLQIRSDFKEMLPDQYRSVVELNKVESRVRSTATLQVIVVGDHWRATKQFIDAFVKEVPKQLGGLIANVDYESNTVKKFYDKNKYLYVDLDDLKEIHNRVKQQIDYEKIKKSPLYIEFGDEPRKFNISDIEDKYKAKTSRYEHYEDGYFTTPDATEAVIILKPIKSATGLEFAEMLMGRVQKVIDSVDPKKFDPSIKTTFGGRFPKLKVEYRSLIGDILSTTVIAVSLVGLVVLLYFRRFRVGILITVTVTQGVMLALAFAYYGIGYLTSQTAFLGSIVVGNGINYSIMLMARYLEERRDTDLPPQACLATSLAHTWIPTLISAVTNATSFFALTMTNIKGFSQFGLIGGVGMPLCWFCTYTFLPAYIILFERTWPMKVKGLSARSFGNIMDPLSRWVAKSYRTVLWFSIGSVVVSVVLIVWYVPNSLEYNFDNLKFKPAKVEDTWENRARNRTNEIFGESQSPSFILADRLDQVSLICPSIKTRSKELLDEQGKEILDSCKTMQDYVPADQHAKLDELKAMRKTLSGNLLKFMSEDQRDEVNRFRNTGDLRPISMKDVPEMLLAGYDEVDGRRGLMALIYPKPTANLWNGKDLIQFAKLVREVPLANGEVLYSSGEPVIFADLLQAVVTEGPKVTMLSFAFVVVMVIVNFRWSRATVVVLGSLLLGVLWMIAGLAIFKIKLNFLNFVALPITFGIGVEYAVNMYQRYLQDGPGSMPEVLQRIGGAVFLCSLTTIIGYGVLCASRNLALVSFGWAALFGEITCLAAALVSLPAYVVWRESKKS